MKEATEQEKEFAVGAYRTSKHFADKNYKLVFGQKFDENKNWYWFDTSTGKYFVDYSHNLMHIVASSLTPLTLSGIPFQSPEEEEQKIERQVMRRIRNLRSYLKEQML